MEAEEYRIVSAHAELARQVRSRCALGIAGRDNLTLAQENEARARELSRIARELVDTGKEPPLRGLRAGAALAEATAPLRSAEAADTTARRSLAALFGVDAPPAYLAGTDMSPPPSPDAPTPTLHLQPAQINPLISQAH